VHFIQRELWCLVDCAVSTGSQAGLQARRSFLGVPWRPRNVPEKANLSRVQAHKSHQ
jgi:hypothetical protein